MSSSPVYSSRHQPDNRSGHSRRSGSPPPPLSPQQQLQQTSTQPYPSSPTRVMSASSQQQYEPPQPNLPITPSHPPVPEKNLESTHDHSSQVDSSRTAHSQQQQPQQHTQPQHHDQGPKEYSGQQHTEGGVEQPQTLSVSGSPYTTPNGSSPADLDKTNTMTTTANPAEYTKAKLFRRRVMRMATVPRLQLLWGLLALFGSMAWFSMMPAYAFRNKLEPAPPANATYTYFLVATVGTSIAALWQSLCPFLVRKSQQKLLPRTISHPIAQSTTIVISVILTILNFFSWIVLVSNNEGGAKTNCKEGPLAAQPGYTAQCRGVNVAIVLDVIVFLLWIPIAAVIVCGTIERGLWWWGEDDGWAQNQDSLAKGGVNMMSEEEFDLKIGLGGDGKARGGNGRNNGSQNQLSHYADEEEEAMESRPAFVTPIATQFRESMGDEECGQDDQDLGQVVPSSYRQHHQQQQQQQQQQTQQQGHDQVQEEVTPRGLVRKTSNASLAPSISARLSTFFGQGWNSGPMPPPQQESPPPTPQIPAQHRPSRLKGTTTVPPRSEDGAPSEPDKASLHGDAYTTQWHNRRYDEWS